MVKLWSIDNPRECKMVLQTGTPVLRAKYPLFLVCCSICCCICCCVCWHISLYATIWFHITVVKIVFSTLTLTRFLPFGTGIVTVAERGNYILRLWSIKDPSTPPTAPIHAFVGHRYPFFFLFSRPSHLYLNKYTWHLLVMVSARLTGGSVGRRKTFSASMPSRCCRGPRISRSAFGALIISFPFLLSSPPLPSLLSFLSFLF